MNLRKQQIQAYWCCCNITYEIKLIIKIITTVAIDELIRTFHHQSIYTLQRLLITGFLYIQLIKQQRRCRCWINLICYVCLTLNKSNTKMFRQINMQYICQLLSNLNPSQIETLNMINNKHDFEHHKPENDTLKTGTHFVDWIQSNKLICVLLICQHQTCRPQKLLDTWSFDAITNI